MNGRGPTKSRSSRVIRLPNRTPAASVDLTRLPTRVLFARGGTTPTGASLQTLRAYADWLQQNPARRLKLLGHANRQTLKTDARALADERAATVRDLVVWLGAAREQVSRIRPSTVHGPEPSSLRSLRQAHRCVDLIAWAPDGGAAEMPRQRPPVNSRRSAAAAR